MEAHCAHRLLALLWLNFAVYEAIGDDCKLRLGSLNCLLQRVICQLMVFMNLTRNCGKLDDDFSLILTGFKVSPFM